MLQDLLVSARLERANEYLFASRLDEEDGGKSDGESTLNCHNKQHRFALFWE